MALAIQSPSQGRSWPKPPEDRLGFDDPSVLPPTALSDEVDVRIQVAHSGVRVLEEVGYTLNTPVIIEAVDQPAGFVGVMVIVVAIAAEILVGRADKAAAGVDAVFCLRWVP